MSALLENITSIEERLIEYGVLGLVCLILIVALVYVYVSHQKFMEERQKATEDRMDKIEANQRETNETFNRVVEVFTTTTKNFEGQVALLNDMKMQNEKVQWELGVINQKVDKIQEKQDKLTMRN